MEEFKKQADKWILVVDKDKDPHSSKQIEVCTSNKMNLKGAIFCNEAEHSKTQACLEVPAFPSFCHLEKKVCLSGLRTEDKHFKQLIDVNKNG